GLGAGSRSPCLIRRNLRPQPGRSPPPRQITRGYRFVWFRVVGKNPSDRSVPVAPHFGQAATPKSVTRGPRESRNGSHWSVSGLTRQGWYFSYSVQRRLLHAKYLPWILRILPASCTSNVLPPCS